MANVITGIRILVSAALLLCPVFSPIFYAMYGDKLIQYDALAVNTIVKNKNNEVSSCDISQSADLLFG
ncbi:hypothetical protein [Oribacterium sp. P6A1]|uniref:hypothetical protein n=1 Tax=Oribacterium sp. P6A1 TaxID=1410612 RepID=UPI000560900F|nr:hypothetical protein [Oribacterium sp. P6A1]